MKSILLRFGVAAALIACLARPAEAHFVLMAPACYSQQDAIGIPEKSPPCGQIDTGVPVVTTGAVTTIEAGSMVTVQIREAIFHPGHYRVAIAADQASLPADPPVTPGATECGSTVINPNPTLPALADGQLLHTQPFSGPQSFTVQIPASFRCDHCVFQVVEFMSDHGLNPQGGCFYHHCATVSVVAPGTDAGTPMDAHVPTPDGSSPGMDASTPVDGASPTPDAGSQPDATSTPTDAASHSDAASPSAGSDAGTTATDAGDSGSQFSGCSCGTVGAPVTGANALLATLIVGVLLVMRRRPR